MSDLSDDYLDYVSEARPVLSPPPFPDWAGVGDRFNIPKDAIKFLSCFPSFSAYGGRMILGDPRVFSGVLPLVFQADPELSHKDTVVIAQSAFGDLFCWNSKHHAVTINLQNATLKCKSLTRSGRIMDRPDIDFDSLISMRDPDAFDIEDENGHLLFSRARKKLGPLEYGQCYGFRLALPLGGYRTLDKLEKLSAPEHFSFLAQLQTFKLIDWGTTDDFGLRVVRDIG